MYDEAEHSLGTLYAADSKDLTYEYTFVAADVGKIEIASVVRYTYQGVSMRNIVYPTTTPVTVQW